MHKQLIRTLACIFLVCLIFQPLPVSARSMADLPKGTILYVKPSGVGDCSSWANACKLYTALAAANPTDQVWVAAGTHKPKTADPDTRLYTFLLESGVAIYGGFAGTETALDQRNWVTNITILSGDIGTAGVETDNTYHVVVGSGVISTAILDGFTIQDGYANGTEETLSDGAGMFLTASSPTLKNLIIADNMVIEGSGGGIYAYQSDLTMENVTITGNTANSGGGLFTEETDSTLTNVLFDNNSALFWGGGMQNEYNGHADLTNVTFTNNSTTGAPGYVQGKGGGMANLWYSSFSLENVTFDGNSAIEHGGGMYNWHASGDGTNVTFSGNSAEYGGGMFIWQNNGALTLSNTAFSQNTASYVGGGLYNSEGSNTVLTDIDFLSNIAAESGGGMLNYASSPTLTRVSFLNNSATNAEGGGFYCQNDGVPVFTDVEFVNNTAGTYGGGAQNYGCNTKYNNVLFKENNAANGGGMSNFVDSHPILKNVTFTGNAASSAGGGIYNWHNIVLELYNGTLVENTAGSVGGGISSHETSETTMMSSIVWGNLPAQNQIANETGCYSVITYSDIQGGWTGTGNIDQDPLLHPLADNGGFSMTFAVYFGSPAIDSGSPYVFPIFDQRGLLRPVDGNGDGTAIADMGAYESQLDKFIYLPITMR